MTHTPHQQNGFSLIESLVAVVVLALGLLGILGGQMRSLTNTQDSARRLQAIRLIEDLSERIKAQPDAVGQAPLYATNGWIDAATTAVDCETNSCTATQFAEFEYANWVTTLSQNLPLAQANVFTTGDNKQLGVMLAWRSNENNATAATALLPANTGDANVECPEERICHLQYISLTQRCIPLSADSAYCSE